MQSLHLKHTADTHWAPSPVTQSIYRLKKACHGELDEDCNLLTPDQVVDRIFELVDENGDGEWFQQVKGQAAVMVTCLCVHCCCMMSCTTARNSGMSGKIIPGNKPSLVA